jgi:hypothetical protein
MAGGLTRASSLVYPSAAAEERERKREKNKKIGASAAAEEEGTLQSLVWSRLPEDLLDKVVQYLPIPALVRGRAVCKRLRDFIFSDRFQEASCCVPTWSSLSTETPYLLVVCRILGFDHCVTWLFWILQTLEKLLSDQMDQNRTHGIFTWLIWVPL